jgi:hypothetical protein
MTAYKTAVRERHLFNPGDVVITPSGRRAILGKFRPDDRWDARYVVAIDGTKGESTILDPKHLKLA